MISLSRMIREIHEFCRGKEKIYIYGAGVYGNKCKKLLDYLNIPVEAFFITKYAGGGYCSTSNVPVIEWNPSIVKPNAGIIAALNKDYHYEINSYIKGFPHMFYMDTKSMIEITTKIGCSVHCRYCPQKKLISTYARKSDKEYLAMEDFIKILNHIPTVTLIRFCGMCEPFLNPQCADMIVYAKEKGFHVDCYSTLVGLDSHDVARVMDAVDGFIPHIPDKEMNAGIPVTDEYIKKLTSVLEYRRNGQRLVEYVSSHGEPDERIKALIPDEVSISTWMQDRAGNLEGDNLHVLHVEMNSPISCEFCDNRLESNILLPNGDLLICCMDYGMEYVFGNLLNEPYEKILNSEEANRVRNDMIYGSQKTICHNCDFAIELFG